MFLQLAIAQFYSMSNKSLLLKENHRTNGFVKIKLFFMRL